MSRQFSGEQEFYPSRSGGTIGGDRKAATAIVYQDIVGGVASTVAVQGDDGSLIAIQASALNTDQIILNAAIAYVNGLGGGSIFIEQSTYNLGASIVPTASLKIYGTGIATVLNGGAITHAFDINGVSDIHILDLACQTTAGGITVFNPINIRGGSTDIHIRRVNILQSDNDGIAITNADSSIHINDCEFTTIDNYPINTDGNDCCIENNHISGVIGNDGIFLGVNSDGCCVKSNHIHAWTGEPIDDDGDNVVEGNICTALGLDVVAWNSKGCGFATVQEAIDHQITNGEIEIVAGVHTVAGGVITLVAANSGLQIKGAGKLVTTLSSSTRHCIQLTSVVNVIIRDLAFQTTGIAIATDGVAILGTCIAIFVIDCVCLDCDQDAVSISSDSSECFIRRNYLYGVIDRYGINNEGDNCNISANRINGTGDDGIWIQAAAANTIVTTNRISNWVGEGIDDDSATTELAHNVVV